MIFRMVLIALVLSSCAYHRAYKDRECNHDHFCCDAGCACCGKKVGHPKSVQQLNVQLIDRIASDSSGLKLIVPSDQKSTINQSLIEVNTEKDSNMLQKEIVLDSLFFEGVWYVRSSDSTFERVEDFFNGSYIVLHPNGKIKSVVHQGDFEACGMLVDTSKYFSTDGILEKEIRHHNWKPNEAEECHEVIQDQYIIEYFTNGTIRAKKMFRNSYDDTEHPSGVWEEFDEKGILISAKNYGYPYDE